MRLHRNFRLSSFLGSPLGLDSSFLIQKCNIFSIRVEAMPMTIVRGEQNSRCMFNHIICRALLHLLLRMIVRPPRTSMLMTRALGTRKSICLALRIIPGPMVELKLQKL